MDLPWYIGPMLDVHHERPGLAIGELRSVENYDALVEEAIRFDDENQYLYNDRDLNLPNCIGKMSNHISGTGNVRTYRLWVDDDTYYCDGSSEWTEDFDPSNRDMPNKDKYPLLWNTIKDIPDLCTVRINTLEPNNASYFHSEKFVVLYKGVITLRLRFHIPLLPPGAISHMYMNKETYLMEREKLYFFNQSAVHAPVNLGTEKRMHLVIDNFFTKDVIDWIGDITPSTPIHVADEMPENLYHARQHPLITDDMVIPENINIIDWKKLNL